MRAHAVAALAIGLAASPADAGPPAGEPSGGERAALAALARVYRSGRHESAVAAATRWSDERITREVQRLIAEDVSRQRTTESEVRVLPSLDVVGLERHTSREAAEERREAEERESRRLAAAAILVESAVSRLRDGELRLLAPGLGVAALLLGREPLGPHARSFARRYYLLAGLALHWHVELAEGSGLLAKALQRFPDDPELQTALGSVIQTVASLRTYAPPPGSPDEGSPASGGYSSERGGYGGGVPGATFAEAKAHYEHALRFDPTLDEARLRLAHVRLLDGRPEAALRDLERLGTGARQPRQRYLAWLFAGCARQRLGDATGAVAAYRACLAQGPRSQTALLALGRSLEQIGDTSGAQEAFSAASAPGAPFDPWWSYGAGQPERFDDLVAELRGLVR